MASQMEFISSSMYLTPLTPADVYRPEYGEKCRGSVTQHFRPKPNHGESSNLPPCSSHHPSTTQVGKSPMGHVPYPYPEDLPNLFIKKKRNGRRQRTSFTLDQLEKLENAFRSSPYPGISERDEISVELGIPESRIQVWFQNRRARHRKKARLAERASAHSSPDNNNGWFPPCSIGVANTAIVPVDPYGAPARWTQQMPPQFHCQPAVQFHNGQDFER